MDAKGANPIGPLQPQGSELAYREQGRSRDTVGQSHGTLWDTEPRFKRGRVEQHMAAAFGEWRKAKPSFWRMRYAQRKDTMGHCGTPSARRQERHQGTSRQMTGWTTGARQARDRLVSGTDRLFDRTVTGLVSVAAGLGQHDLSVPPVSHRQKKRSAF